MDEREIEGTIHTPDIILCRDPPIINQSIDILDGELRLWNSEIGSNPADLMEPNVSVKKLKTFFKVTQYSRFFFSCKSNLRKANVCLSVITRPTSVGL